MLQQPASFHFSKELFSTKVESVPTAPDGVDDKDKRRSVPESTTLEEVPADGAC